MSQNDFTLANQSFPAFRADLNSALQALASNNSGTSAPSTTFANMWWYDSTNNIMYIRNEDNDAWIKFAELDQTNDKFVLSGTLQLDDGTVSAPALTFNSDTNMGIYRGGTDILKFVTAGTDAVTIDASQGVTLAGKLDVSSGTIKLDGDYPLGTENVALGNRALDSGSLTGQRNVAIGTDALTDNTSGLDNIAVGRRALYENTTGSSNIAIGRNTLDANTTGITNIAVGLDALGENTTASENTAVGYQSMQTNTTGVNNTALGKNSLSANTTGQNNTALGRLALYNNTTASNNVAIGNSSMQLNTTGTSNVAVGASAMSANTGNSNTAVGYSALTANTSGNDNVAVGYQTMSANTTGGKNTALGRQAFSANTTGSGNVGIGYNTLDANTTGGNNTAIGREALTSNTTATDCVAIGYASGANNTAGNSNTFVGRVSGYSTYGASNTLIGEQAGYFISSGTKNTIIGRYNGNQGGLDIRTSSNNIVLSDGDGNPRASIDVNGVLVVGKTTNSHSTAGFGVTAGGVGNFVADSTTPLIINRLTNDNKLISLRQDSNEEGNIYVSGTTVSYNGGHLSRWSRLIDNSKDETIVKGTVMTNLDEMVEWGDEDNEQLNKMAVSSVEGDANVAGVFVNWDNEDDWNDMNIGMTGDMVIRIAQETTVARGDLLMSAGDGTAKPQGDDIVRSKTIAKVTSTNVSHTYDDGTYLVPCVLMAC